MGRVGVGNSDGSVGVLCQGIEASMTKVTGAEEKLALFCT